MDVISITIFDLEEKYSNKEKFLLAHFKKYFQSFKIRLVYEF